MTCTNRCIALLYINCIFGKHSVSILYYVNKNRIMVDFFDNKTHLQNVLRCFEVYFDNVLTIFQISSKSRCLKKKNVFRLLLKLFRNVFCIFQEAKSL